MALKIYIYFGAIQQLLLCENAVIKWNHIGHNIWYRLENYIHVHMKAYSSWCLILQTFLSYRWQEIDSLKYGKKSSH